MYDKFSWSFPYHTSDILYIVLNVIYKMQTKLDIIICIWLLQRFCEADITHPIYST